MKELLKYKSELSHLNVEQLLDKLEKEVAQKEYHRFVSKNDTREIECENKILLIKMRIMENVETLKDSLLNAVFDDNKTSN